MVETPRSEHFDDIYFAVEDGLTESRYVFLEQNHLPELWVGCNRFVIAETGFGTGLNFLCAWDLFEKTAAPHQQLHYYSFEKYPLSAADIQKYLAHWADAFGGKLQMLVDRYPLRVGGWHTIRLSPQVTLTVIFDDVNRALPELDTPVDCWFLDGHAPAKNPDMWSETVFSHIGRLSHEGTRFATFTAAGFVRRGLEAVGFDVSKARGFGRKRDMSVGVFTRKKPLSAIPDMNGAVNGKMPKRIAIIGGGIAGAAMAAALGRYGCDVTLYERGDIACGGSGNIRGLCNPKITALRGIEADFYGPAFALANRMFRDISANADIGFIPCGSLHLLTDDQKEKRFPQFITNWGWDAAHARMVTAAEASDIAGVQLSHAALYLPEAGAVSPQKLTRHLSGGARLVKGDVIDIQKVDGLGWRVVTNPSVPPCPDDESKVFDAVAIANGYDALRFGFLSSLPLQKIRGQVTHIDVPVEGGAAPKVNLCYGGYMAAAVNGQSVVGSTFQHWMDNGSIRDEDNADNISKLRAIAPSLADSVGVTGARAAFRCAAKDRLPIIGAVPGHDGLYLSIAHGSHGILSSLMGAEMLVCKMFSLPQILPMTTKNFLSRRFFS